MKNIYKLTIIVSILMGLFSCSGSTYDGNEYTFVGGNEVKFNSTIADPNVTGVSTQWKSGDKVGITMTRDLTNLIVNNSRNIEYNADPSGELNANGTAIVFSESESYKHSFYAYYPYQESLSDFIYQIDLRTQTDQSKLVLLYGKTEGVDNSATSVDIAFGQKLTKLMFNISPGVGFTEADLAGIKVELKDMNALADFNLSVGQITRQREILNISTLVSEQGKKAEAIVIPNKDTKLKLRLTLTNSVSYEWESPVLTLAEATKYAYNIAIGTNMVEVSQGTITNWTGIDETPIEGEGKPSTAAKYNVGDLYPDATNPVGIVFEVSNGGKNGKIASLFLELQNRWGGIQDESTNGIPSVRDADNGKVATMDIINGRRNWGNFTSDYAIFEWLYNTVNGGDINGKWYLPAKNELKSLYAAMSGLTYADIETTWTDNAAMPGYDSQSCVNARDAFNLKITDAGGTWLHPYAWYWTTTEIDNNTAWSVQFETGVMQSIKIKWDHGKARPIMQF